MLKQLIRAQPLNNLPKINWIEIELNEACNLSCYGCGNYSDYEHSSWTAWEVGKKWIEPWLNRIKITNLSLIGGEPLLNPELKKWLNGLRQLMPRTHLHLSSNGLLIYKNQWLLDTMREIRHCTLSIAPHTPHDPKFLLGMDIIKNYPGWVVGNNRWFLKTKMETFLKTYKNDFHNMKPYNSDPNLSFSICRQQHCPLIYEGKIYKCSAVGKLSMVLSDWGHINDKDWKPYLDYQPLTIDCSEIELQKFLDNWGKHAEICSMCPEPKDLAEIDHLSTVLKKSQKRIIPIRN